MSEKYQQQIIEALDAKKRQWITQNVQRIIAEQGAMITDDEFQQLVENSLQFMNEQEAQGIIVVNEMNL